MATKSKYYALFCKHGDGVVANKQTQQVHIYPTKKAARAQMDDDHEYVGAVFIKAA